MQEVTLRPRRVQKKGNLKNLVTRLVVDMDSYRCFSKEGTIVQAQRNVCKHLAVNYSGDESEKSTYLPDKKTNTGDER